MSRFGELAVGGILIATLVAIGVFSLPSSEFASGAHNVRQAPSDLLVPLSGVEPAAGGTDQDLARLAEWLGAARLVGLGENVHGTHELHRLTHRIFEYLARTSDFEVLALEVSQAHALGLDDYVQGRRDDLDELMRARWWTAEPFYDLALRDLLVWMRGHNERAKRSLHIAGYDFKQPLFAMDLVVDYLARSSSARAAWAREQYSQLLELGGFGVFPNVYGFTSTVTVPLPFGSEARTVRLRAQIRAEETTFGWVGVTLAAAGPESWTLREGRSIAGAEVGGNWMPVEVELEVSPELEAVEVEFFHRGNGVVWFDESSLEVAGIPLDFVPHLEALDERTLMIPDLQVMDYEAALDGQGGLDGGTALRIRCAPQLDAALAAVHEVDAVLAREVELARDRGSLSDSEAGLLLQMSRLVIQSTSWRTLAENNRDVFLAENLGWLLARSGARVPGGRILALGHTSHTERTPRKMGGLLAAALGTDYVAVSMLAQGGRYAYFGPVATFQPGDGLEVFVIDGAGEGSLDHNLSTLGDGGLLFNLARASAWGDAPDWLSAVLSAGFDSFDIAILVPKVGPARPAGRTPAGTE